MSMPGNQFQIFALLITLLDLHLSSFKVISHLYSSFPIAVGQQQQLQMALQLQMAMQQQALQQHAVPLGIQQLIQQPPTDPNPVMIPPEEGVEAEAEGAVGDGDLVLPPAQLDLPPTPLKAKKNPLFLLLKPLNGTTSKLQLTSAH